MTVNRAGRGLQPQHRSSHFPEPNDPDVQWLSFEGRNTFWNG
jgi:hypothetical protein